MPPMTRSRAGKGEVATDMMAIYMACGPYLAYILAAGWTGSGFFLSVGRV